MKKIIFSLWLLSLLVFESIAQPLFPVNDVRDEKESAYAFVNATVYVDYQTVIENSILLIKKGKIIGIVTEGDVEVKALADHVIEVPETLESLSPLLTTIPLQLLSYHIAVMLNRNVDQPRNLAKSVTVE